MNPTKNYELLIFLDNPITNHDVDRSFQKLQKSLPHQNITIEDIYWPAVDNFDHYKQVCVCSVTVAGHAEENYHSHWRAELDNLLLSFNADYCVLEKGSHYGPFHLAVFDMDSTLIPMEVIDELAEEAGVKEQVSAITESAMQGNLDFNESFTQRLMILRGMSSSAVEAVKARLRFNTGVKEFLSTLNDDGVVLAIASGGFHPFAEHLCESVAFKYVNANQLEFINGELSGRALPPIVNADIKAQSLREWCQHEGISSHNVIAVGDGANDALMLDEAGLGVAYKAKPFLRSKADCVLHCKEMDALTDILKAVAQVTGEGAKL